MTARTLKFHEMLRVLHDHPYGRSGGVSTSARVDPGLVRAELGQLFVTRWFGLKTGLEMRVRSARTVIVTGSLQYP